MMKFYMTKKLPDFPISEEHCEWVRSGKICVVKKRMMMDLNRTKREIKSLKEKLSKSQDQEELNDNNPICSNYDTLSHILRIEKLVDQIIGQIELNK